MASIKVYSVGRLARYVTGSSLRSLRVNMYRSTSQEGKKLDLEPAAEAKAASIEECHKQIESLTADLNTLKLRVTDYEDKYKRTLAAYESRKLKEVEDAKSFDIESFCMDFLYLKGMEGLDADIEGFWGELDE